ncbi:MAG: DUF2007 domain-containing protein [Sandaracinaceae bacterium]
MAKLVTLRHVNDPIEARMLVDLLEQEGIPASAPGNEHNQMVGGLLGGALNVPLQVPAADAERAKAILSALVEYDEIDPDDARLPEGVDSHEGAPYRGHRGLDPSMPPRRVLVAVAVAFLLPCMLTAFGAGHFYAREYRRGFALLAAGWFSLVLAFTLAPWAWTLVVLVMVLDAYGSATLISRANAT